MGARSEGGCPFCELPPERVVDSTPHTVSFLDRFPVSYGHTLIVPRRHVTTPFELTATEFSDIFAVLLCVRERLAAAHCPKGFNIGFNVGVAGGQTVEHVHLHVIPRYGGDCTDPTGGIRNVVPGRGKY
jgi:diadenosine tetraphosphate (Ap4A) HIT family hydrolase